MSIWATTATIGLNDNYEHDGSVLAAPPSHVYPDPAGSLPAMVDLAEIPEWCVPGHRDNDLGERVGAWLRLTASSPAGTIATGVLNVQAATDLRDALTEWLELDHVHPEEEQ